MKHKRSGKYVYKLHSKDIRKAKYNVSLPLSEAMRNNQEAIITLGDSQIMRFIDSLNGDLENDNKTRRIKSEIKYLRGIKTTNSTKAKLQVLYEELYNLQFCKDYICVVMDSNKDYDLLNKNGFSVNGIEYTRLLGTNGGIKQSTIVYVSKRLYDALKTKIDNGRNKDIKLVPAKLEAYQALVCSGSVPVPKPRGIIVVGDCITHFKDDVIVLDDSNGGEPTLTYVDDYEVEHNNSDGFGLMMPEYARNVNKDLTGNDTVLSGFNSRYAWNKGMVYAFDFVDFAEKVANTYEIVDAWGDKRDVREADVILTTSMLKLWDSYDSWEDYYNNCELNGYEFSATKTTPEELEHVHTLNYQFLQSYDLTDDELRELVQPTIDNLKDVIGMDYRKSLLFLSGMALNKDSAISSFEDDNCDYVTKALMLEPKMIQDPYIIKRIKSMANKKINDAKKGVIAVEANYAMVGGDPFALCQSMFGLAVTGLLKSGELYHRYFTDKGADELVCFRAPMTNANNIRKLRLNKSIECAYWFRFIKTAVIINAWDTTCDALNGANLYKLAHCTVTYS